MNTFRNSLEKKAGQGVIPVIPDFKCVSPGEGPLFEQRDAVFLAEKMVSAGAPVLSVVTEKEEFGGSLSMLEEIAGAVEVPVLRKDFVSSKEDILDTKKCGAEAILLICACIEEKNLRRLYEFALENELEPLVEAHSSSELMLASELGASLVGINNRDILQLEKDGGDVTTTVGLAQEKPEGAFLISESGILTPEDAKKAVQNGADAILVGTAIWKAENPFDFYRQLVQAGGNPK